MGLIANVFDADFEIHLCLLWEDKGTREIIAVLSLRLRYSGINWHSGYSIKVQWSMWGKRINCLFAFHDQLAVELFRDFLRRSNRRLDYPEHDCRRKSVVFLNPSQIQWAA
jgi:hypothetical protein